MLKQKLNESVRELETRATAVSAVRERAGMMSEHGRDGRGTRIFRFEFPDGLKLNHFDLEGNVAWNNPTVSVRAWA